ncbi:hypothetical protein, partial [Bacillus pumilus]|uniref:hypothetical protein n=1 Tax=Bacillus pumilus TaxID=1408 RepID=UPI0011A58A40
MMGVMVSLVVVVVIDEIGDIVMMMVCKKVEKREVFDFVVRIDWKDVGMVDERFGRRSFNVMVGVGGGLFGVFRSIVVFLMWK